MKSFLIPIRPKWVAKILNGEKTREIRKTAPKEWMDYLSGKTKKKPEPMTGYIYCTKKGGLMRDVTPVTTYFVSSPVGPVTSNESERLEGKVVAKFTLDEIEEICFAPFGDELSEEEERLCSESCMSFEELVGYLRGGMFGYSWHISDLVIFDEPKELGEFYFWRRNKPTKNDLEFAKLTGSKIFCAKRLLPLNRAPQSWCYVEELK